MRKIADERGFQGLGDVNSLYKSMSFQRAVMINGGFNDKDGDGFASSSSLF